MLCQVLILGKAPTREAFQLKIEKDKVEIEVVQVGLKYKIYAADEILNDKLNLQDSLWHGKTTSNFSDNPETNHFKNRSFLYFICAKRYQECAERHKSVGPPRTLRVAGPHVKMIRNRLGCFSQTTNPPPSG